MQKNKYKLVHFIREKFTQTTTLTVIPKPDSILRVFMVFKALDSKIEIEEQKIKPFDRKGFTIVEWGGAEIK